MTNLKIIQLQFKQFSLDLGVMWLFLNLMVDPNLYSMHVITKLVSFSPWMYQEAGVLVLLCKQL